MSPQHISPKQATEMIDRLTVERNRCVEVLANQDGEIARLQARNAELIEALKDMIEITEDIPHYAARAQALIAKAKGEHGVAST